MTIETLLGFRNIDSTEHLNSRLSGLIPKGIVRGGLVVPEPASLQIRIKGSPEDDVVFMAFAKDGMMIRERAEERVLPVIAGITNVICLRAKFLESQDPIAQLEVLTLGAYESDADQDSLIRFATVTPPAGATSVLVEHINTSFRDSIEGFRRGIIRGVVDTKVDLPATSGFPATAEINFITNDFAEGSSITIDTGATSLTYPLITPISFPIANPGVPGFSRINSSQKAIVDAVQSLTGQVTVTTILDHGFLPGMTVRLSDNTASQANRVWTIESTPTTKTFTFTAPLTIPWTGYGGSAVDSFTPAIITATIASGYTHSLIPGQQFIVTGATDQSFNGLYTVQDVVDEQQFTYTQVGYPTRDSGNGKINKVGFSLPLNAVEIGTTADITALNFQNAVRSSELDGDLKIFALGSSLQIEARVSGTPGNGYQLSKLEPGAITPNIVLANFSGGIDPNATSSQASSESLQKGDLYVVLFGDLGTIELWGYDGSIFRNMTSASAATLLDFHRRNLFVNEKHLSENEKAALTGTVGVPSATNRFVTEQDTSVLTETLAAALQGADSTPPGQSNRYLTEARVRGERASILVPEGQDLIELPLGEAWVIGPDNNATDDSLTKQFFNVVHTDTLLSAGGFTEYSQRDFTPIQVTDVYVSASGTPFNPSLYASYNGVYPRADAVLSGLPMQLYVKLSGVPNNGSATLLYSKAVKEASRVPQADMLMGPQRVLPSVVQDLINRTKELRFNNGISVSGKAFSFPENLFWAENMQGFSFRRYVALRPVEIRDAFSINFQTGTGTSGLVESFTPVEFSGNSLNQWTKYCLFVTPQNKVRVQHIEALLENPNTSLAYASSRADLEGPVLPMTDGSWLFATVAVKSNGTVGSGILDVEQDSLEIFHYQNSREPGADTVVGDGLTSFGQFNGENSHLHALLHAKSGDKIRLLQGTYTGHVVIEKDDITLDCSSGAVLTNPGATAVTVLGKRFRLIQPHFSDCSVAVALQPGADSFQLEKPVYSETVGRRIKTPPVVSFTASSVSVATSSFSYNNHGLLDGARLRLKSAGVLPSGLSSTVDYYVVQSNANSFKLALTKSGSPVAFLDGGTDLHSFSDGSTFDAMIDGTAVATWRVTDGTHNLWAGEFNSPNGIQDAIDAASPGDTILVYPGSYNRILVGKDRLQLNGLGGSGVVIDGGGSLQQAVLITGRHNQIDNFFITNAGVGIRCQGTYNTFGTNIQFDENVKTTVTFPETIATKHYNVYPSLTGRITTGEGSVPANASVTVGDGVSSWGDYVGRDAINLALATESAGTLIQVFRGDYRQITVDGTINGMAVIGTPGKETVIRADALRTTQCISINGSNNYFRNLYLIADNNDADAVGFSTLGVKVNGDDNYFENIEFPVTGGERIESHLKYQVVSGARNRFIPHTGAPVGEISWTVGDGVRSFGDFNGSQGINAAVQALPTQPRTLSGEIFEAEGSTAKLRVAKTYTITSVNVSTSTLTKAAHGLVLNEPVTLVTTDVLPAPLQASPLGPTYTRYYVINADTDTFQLATIPATERASFSATSVVSSTVTIESHGLSNGTQVSLTTTSDLPSGLFKSRTYFIVNATANTLQFSETLGGSAVQLFDGGTGTHRIFAGSPVSLTDEGSGTHTVVSALPFNFSFDDLYRNVNISSAVEPANLGSYRITEILGRSEVLLERIDGRAFTDETEVVCDIVSGAKICVLAGVYDPFTIPTSRNDVELYAWGSGADTLIKGESDTEVLLTINGSRCLIRGFRFAGGHPENGLAVQVNGCNNTFIGNRFETAKTYAFGNHALGNRVHDSYEAVARTAITVGTSNSRADFIGSTEEAIQAAVNLAAQDSHIKMVILGEGQWTLSASVSVPAGLVIQGSGEKTELLGDGSFAAFSLASDGGQKIGNLKLSDFTFAAEGSSSNVLLADLWLHNTDLDPSVSQGEVINSQSLKVGKDFAVSNSGDLEKIKGVNYSFPTTQAAGSNYTLINDGSGNLSWEQSSAYLSALNDVSIASPQAGEFLVSDGSLWTNESVFIPSGLSTLTDVAVDSVTNGQVLVFNGTSWINQDVAGATNALNSLIDVEVSSPSVGQVLVYDGSNWSNVDRGMPLDDLLDVEVSLPSSGEVLSFNGSSWVNAAPSLEDAGDVSISSPVPGQVLSFNGSSWVNESVQISTKLSDIMDVTLTSSSSGDLLRKYGADWVNESPLVSRLEMGHIPSESQLTLGAPVSVGQITANSSAEQAFYSGISKVAQKFTLADFGQIDSVVLKLRRTGSYNSTASKVVVSIVADSGDLPSTSVLATSTVDFYTLATSTLTETTFSFSSLLLPAGTYWIVFSVDEEFQAQENIANLVFMTVFDPILAGSKYVTDFLGTTTWIIPPGSTRFLGYLVNTVSLTSTDIYDAGTSYVTASGFTVDGPIRLSSVDLIFTSNTFSGSGDCYVEIRKTQGFAVSGLPTLPGSIIATSDTLSLSSFSGISQPVSKALTMPTPVTLLPGESYYVVVKVDVSSGTGAVTVAVNPSIPLSDRYLWKSTNNGSTWQPSSETTELYYSFYGTVGLGNQRVIATDDFGYLDQSMLKYPLPTQLSSPVSGDLLSYDGSYWVNQPQPQAIAAGFGATNGYAYVMLVQGDYTYMGGSFTSYTDPLNRVTPANHIVKINNITGEIDPTFDTTVGADGYVFAIVPDNEGNLFIGGLFTTYNGVSRKRLAKISAATGELDLTFDTSEGPNNSVFAIAYDGSGGLFVGGSFNLYGSTSKSCLAKVNSLTAALDTGFTGGVSNSSIPPQPRVMTLLYSAVDNALFVGGQFNRVVEGSTPYASPAIAKLASGSGARISSFAPSISIADVFALALTTINNVSTLVVGRNTSNSSDHVLLLKASDGSQTQGLRFDDVSAVSVRAFLVPDDGTLYISGSFTKYLGVSYGGVIRVFLDDLSPVPSFDSAARTSFVDTYSLAVYGDTLFLSDYYGFSRLDRNTGKASSGVEQNSDRLVKTNLYGYIDNSLLQYDLDLGGNRITGLAEPTAPHGAATRNYVDTNIEATNANIDATNANISSQITTLTGLLPKLNTVEFLTSTTWTAPAGVTQILVYGFGGGQGGGGAGRVSSTTAGSPGALGGAAAMPRLVPWTVTPGVTYTITIGAGGAGGAGATTAGANGVAGAFGSPTSIIAPGYSSFLQFSGAISANAGQIATVTPSGVFPQVGYPQFGRGTADVIIYNNAECFSYGATGANVSGGGYGGAGGSPGPRGAGANGGAAGTTNTAGQGGAGGNGLNAPANSGAGGGGAGGGGRGTTAAGVGGAGGAGGSGYLSISYVK